MKYLLLIAVLFYADYYYKRKVESEMKPGRDTRIAAGGKVLIRRTENKGAAGGILSGRSTYVKIASTVAAALAAVRFLFLLPMKKRALKKGAYAFFLAGALSNLYDRWVRGSVTDYISLVSRRVKSVQRIVFNLGDVFILIGGLTLILLNLFRRKK
jgi:signal peptidase II